MNMAELQTPVAQPETHSAPQPPKKKNNGNRKKIITRVVGIVVAVAIVGGIAFGTYKFMNPKEEKTILTDFVTLGSIQSTVEGRGTLSAKNAAALTLSTAGTVQEVFVNEGDLVTEGDPLYTIDSSEAMDAVNSAQETVNNYQKQLQAIYDSYADLEIRAPFAGKLVDVEKINDGANVSSGTKIATLVDDSKMRLSMYVNYAYQNDISVGQTVRVSIPASMTEITDATVEQVNLVRYITPEGSQCFEVVVVMNNPGSLTAGMGATAVFTSPLSGEAIYPYSAGTLEYYRSAEMVTKVSGEALSSYLINYIDVPEGQLLLHLSADDNDEQIAGLQNQLKTAQDALQKAQENLANFNAVAPISGTVLLCNLTPGQEVSSGTTVVQIADTSTLTASIQVDERNYAFVKAGMDIQLMDYNDNTFFGTIKSIGMTPMENNGGSTTYYEAIVEVDNSTGTLSAGMSLQYSLVASEATDCLVVPMQSVQYISDEEGNPLTVVFLKTDTRPENAVTMPTEANDSIPKESDGFYAVPVEVGLNSDTQVEIRSGLNEGDEVFTGFLTSDYSGGF